MKLRVLLSILFIIVTTFSAIHELEHISHEHSSASCSICIIDHSLVSGDITQSFTPLIVCSFDAITSTTPLLFLYFKKRTNHANAPPQIV